MKELPKALQEKLDGIPMTEWDNVVNDPRKYGLSVYEFFTLADFLSDIAKSINESTQTPDEKYTALYNQNQKLLEENRKLRLEIASYERFISDIREAQTIIKDALEDFE